MSTQPKIIWSPLPGGQETFLQCPIFECLAQGSRGSGKTEVLLMDYAQHIGQGYGGAWRGILFRVTFPQLADAVYKAQRLFSRIFPNARWNEAKHAYIFEDGETLYFRYIEKFKDYWSYHGHEYPWIGFEELISWPTNECYEAMKSCCRSSFPKIPKHYRATTNPFGPGHNWIKRHFIDAAPPGEIITNEQGEERTHVRIMLHENTVLMEADPKYLQSLKSIKDPMKKRAWLLGDWDITSGGALDDLWNRDIHVIKPFTVPKEWYIDRSFDWGSSHPFSVGWWAMANGEKLPGQSVHIPKGTLFRIAEWYGCEEGEENKGVKMLASDIAKKILLIEKSFNFKVHPGPADPSIFYKENGNSIAGDMRRLGVRWHPADNSPGSRKLGLEKLRQYLAASLSYPRLEDPGIFIFDTCKDFIRTVPVLLRDSKVPDDVDSKQEDHAYDETRYRVFNKRRRSITSDTGV